MPDDRFIHRRLGHSEKVNTLTDFEFRVWAQYVLSSDDFGVMRFTAATLQADNDALGQKPMKQVQRALDRLAIMGLIRTFVHQSRTYCYQHDWQDWQKVEYPRATLHPQPPSEGMTPATARLFAKFPGGWGRKGDKPSAFAERSPNVPQTDPEPFGERSGEITLEPVACSQEPKPLALAVSRPPLPHPARAHGMQTLHRGSHRGHSWCGERSCVPEFLHERFAKAIGSSTADADLRAFYADTLDSLPESQRIDSDPVKFWQPLVTARWPPQDATVGTRTAALQRATSEFLRGAK